MHDRVVVTGYGAVTPLADNADGTWRAVLSGESGIGRITAFDPAAFTSQIAGEVTPWDPKAKLGPKHARRTDRFTQFALEASRAALEHSGLEITEANRHRVGSTSAPASAVWCFCRTRPMCCASAARPA